MNTPLKPFAKAKRAVLKALRARGIASVEITYDGEGDSGQIDDIAAYDVKNLPVPLDQAVSLALREGEEATRYCSFTEALDDFAWTILQELHGCFQDNEGGFGTIVINVAEGTVRLEHNDRFTDVVTTETEV